VDGKMARKKWRYNGMNSSIGSAQGRRILKRFSWLSSQLLATVQLANGSNEGVLKNVIKDQSGG
jgi:hypothetical protein